MLLLQDVGSNGVNPVLGSATPDKVEALLPMMRGRSTLLMALAALAAALLVAGCGAGTESSSQGEKLTFEVSNAGVEQAESRATREPAAHCDNGAASVGESRDTVQFRVRCTGSESGGRASFVVERYLPHGPVHMRGPRRNQESLKVGSGSGEARRGHCKVRHRILECGAEVSGSVSLAGAFAVQRRTACALAVSIVEVRVRPCDPGGCQGPVRVRELFDGRPTGC